MEMTVMNTQKPRIRSAGKTGPWALTFLLWIFIFPSASFGETVLVIRERGAAFEKALKGLQDELENEMEIRELVIGPATPADSAARVITDAKPVMAVLMDNRAVGMFKAWQDSLPDAAGSMPSVSCMGIDIRSSIKELRNAVGIAYEVPIVTSLVALRAALNRPLKKAGIIHRKWQRVFIEENREYCLKEDIELVTRELPDSPAAFRSALKPALESLLETEEVQALWVPNDNILLTPELIQDIWSPLIGRYKVPAVVGVETLVNPALDMGTFAVLPDHRAMGAQAAEFLLNTRDNGWKVWEGNVEPPVAVKKTVNLRQMTRFFGLERKDLGSVDTFLVAEKGMDIRFASSRGASQGQLSLADLLNMEITSVSKRSEKLQDAAASVYVITEEDIRRSGAVRLQDLLNQVPGAWYVDYSYLTPQSSIREVPEVFSQSVNMMVDGVPVTNLVTGGVFYQNFLPPLSEIKRIEIIKGPGGTIYGANSATGIVSIITKNAHESEGIATGLKLGTQDYLEPHITYGRPLWDGTAIGLHASGRHHRGYDKNPDFKGSHLTVPTPEGAVVQIRNKFPREDDGERNAVNLKMNLNSNINHHADLSFNTSYIGSWGNNYSGVQFPYDSSGQKPEDSVWIENTHNTATSVSGRLDIAVREHHRGFFSTYHRYDDTHNQTSRYNNFNVRTHYLNFELQDMIELFSASPVNLELIFGSNFSLMHIRFENDFAHGQIFFKDPVQTEYITAGFLQNKISLGKYADIISGAKAETWTLVKKEPEIMPSIRLAVKPLENFTIWGAWSRSVTTPGYMQTQLEARSVPTSIKYFAEALGVADSVVPLLMGPGVGKWIAIVNSEGIRPTVYHTSEGGLRYSPLPELTLDGSFFSTAFKDRIAVTQLDAASFRTVLPSEVIPGDSIVPVYYANLWKGSLYGSEILIKSRPFSSLRLEISHAWFAYTRRIQDNIPGPDIEYTAPKDLIPHHVLRYRFYLALPADIYLTLNGLWHSGYKNSEFYDFISQTSPARAENGVKIGDIDPGLKFDVILEKMYLQRDLRLYVWGKNIFQGHQVEAYNPYAPLLYPQSAHRTFGAGVSYKF